MNAGGDFGWPTAAPGPIGARAPPTVLGSALVGSAAEPDPTQRLLGLLAGHGPGGSTVALLGLGLPSLGELPLTGLPVLGDRVLLDLHPDVSVPAQAGAGRDQLSDDDVLLQPEQRVALRAD